MCWCDRYVRLGSALMARSKWATAAKAISKSDIMMQMIDKSIEQSQSGELSSTIHTVMLGSMGTSHSGDPDPDVDSDDDTHVSDIWSGVKSPSTKARSLFDDISHNSLGSDSDDDTTMSDLWKRTTSSRATAAAIVPVEERGNPSEEDSDDDSKTSDIWGKDTRKVSDSFHRGSVDDRAEGTTRYGEEGGGPPAQVSVASEDADEVESDIEDVDVSIEEYMVCVYFSVATCMIGWWVSSDLF